MTEPDTVESLEARLNDDPLNPVLAKAVAEDAIAALRDALQDQTVLEMMPEGSADLLAEAVEQRDEAQRKLDEQLTEGEREILDGFQTKNPYHVALKVIRERDGARAEARKYKHIVEGPCCDYCGRQDTNCSWGCPKDAENGCLPCLYANLLRLRKKHSEKLDEVDRLREAVEVKDEALEDAMGAIEHLAGQAGRNWNLKMQEKALKHGQESEDGDEP